MTAVMPASPGAPGTESQGGAGMAPTTPAFSVQHERDASRDAAEDAHQRGCECGDCEQFVRVRRWRTAGQTVVRELLGRNHRSAKCERQPAPRRAPAEDHEALEGAPAGVDMVVDSGGRWSFRGLYLCASWWSCQGCLTAVMMHLAATTATAAVRHATAGGVTLMFVLTVPHSPWWGPGEVWDYLDGAWTHMTRQDSWRQFRRRWGVAEYVMAAEPNVRMPAKSADGRWFGGWQIHRQGLLFVDGGLWARANGDPETAERQVTEMRREWTQLWGAALRAAGCDRKLGEETGVHLGLVDDPAVAGHYTFKLGLETFSPGGKHGRIEGSFPAVELPAVIAERCAGRPVADVAKTDPEVRWWANALAEFVQAASGRKLRQMSSGYYRRFLSDVERMPLSKVRMKARKLQQEDRPRFAAAVAELHRSRTGGDTADGEEASEDGAEEADSDPEAPVEIAVIRLTDDVFGDIQAAYESPDRYAGDMHPALAVRRAQRVAFRVAACEVAERYGPVFAALILGGAHARPVPVWQRGAALILDRREPGEDWTELQWDPTAWRELLDTLLPIAA